MIRLTTKRKNDEIYVPIIEHIDPLTPGNYLEVWPVVKHKGIYYVLGGNKGNGIMKEVQGKRGHTHEDLRIVRTMSGLEILTLDKGLCAPHMDTLDLKIEQISEILSDKNTEQELPEFTYESDREIYSPLKLKAIGTLG